MWTLLFIGGILFTPFYVFLVFLYFRISSWERFVMSYAGNPAHRDHVQKIINIGENVVYDRMVPMFVDKLDHAVDIIDRITRRFGVDMR